MHHMVDRPDKEGEERKSDWNGCSTIALLLCHIYSTSNSTGTGASTSKLMYLTSLFTALTLDLAEARLNAATMDFVQKFFSSLLRF